MLTRRTSIKTALFLIILTGLYFLPEAILAWQNPLAAGLAMLHDFARLHLLYAMLPALAIAAIISASINRPAVIRYMTSAAGRGVAYSTAALSGAILSVCSCSVLPLFAGIRRMGAGLGPACTFLFAAPAINVMAVILTARVMGWQMGLARGAASLIFGVIIGVIMNRLCGKTEQPAKAPDAAIPAERASVPALRVAAVIAGLMLITVLLTFSPSGFKGLLRCCPDGKTAVAISGQVIGQDGQRFHYRDQAGQEQVVDADLVEAVELDSTFNYRLYRNRLALAGLAGLVLLVMLAAWFSRNDLRQWGQEGLLLARQILPMLLAGVFLSGLILGSPGQAGLLPKGWVAGAVGGNSLQANAAAAMVGAAMYFATLTEVPIVQGLMNSGMGHGPALAMLLAGPAISLPSLLVLGSLMGWRKTLLYAALVVAAATCCGVVFGIAYP